MQCDCLWGRMRTCFGEDCLSGETNTFLEALTLCRLGRWLNPWRARLAGGGVEKPLGGNSGLSPQTQTLSNADIPVAQTVAQAVGVKDWSVTTDGHPLTDRLKYRQLQQ